MTPKTPQVGPNIFPCLRYHDAPAAIEWLVKAFGFEKQMVVPGPDGTIAFRAQVDQWDQIFAAKMKE